ncbi:MAG TPA: ABC transporter ATP-binding protein [Gemmatimonadaceae bacterium]|nr:ABC transporter ATP-binding protein [Gemmatimonadaceae bacterium]
MSLIRLTGVTRVYRSESLAVRALRGIDLAVEAGEFVAIMGASGSGKSTLMNILGCLDRPTTGSYILDGEDVATVPRDRLAQIRNRGLGFVFQNFHLLPRTSALENVELPLLYSDEPLSWSEIHDRARAALEMLGLGDRTGHTPAELSGGQQQRVAIARALVTQPRLILADEPTGNLDSRTSLEIMDVFQRLNGEGYSILMVTHEPDMARFASRIIVLRDGLIRTDRRIEPRSAADAMAHGGDDLDAELEMEIAS